VQKDAATIVVEGKVVISESSNLKNITNGIGQSMQEMAAGAEHIKFAVNRVNEISNGNKSSIDTLIREVVKFKIG
jgi:hypothetical protein